MPGPKLKTPLDYQNVRVMERTDEDGNLVHKNVAVEIQHAQQVFGVVPDVFEVRGTMRFHIGDPLMGILQCMRTGKKFPDELWGPPSD